MRHTPSLHQAPGRQMVRRCSLTAACTFRKPLSEAARVVQLESLDDSMHAVRGVRTCQG